MKEESVKENDVKEEQDSLITNDESLTTNKEEIKTTNNEEDLAKHNEAETEEEVSLGSDEWYKRDKEAFDKAYPELDKEKLFSDRDFLNFAEGKVGERSLTEIYSDYNTLVSTIRERTLEEAEREFESRINKARSTPGSLTEVADVSDNGYYTLDEMKRMSQEYVEAHWDKVRESLRRIKK